MVNKLTRQDVSESRIIHEPIMSEECSNDAIIDRAFRGDLSTTVSGAVPRLLKLFVAAPKRDMEAERSMLMENVASKLRTLYYSTGLEVEILDMQRACKFDPLTDPYQYHEHLNYIKTCQKLSRGCFFLCLIGGDHWWTPSPLPVYLTREEWQLLLTHADEGFDREAYIKCEHDDLYQLNPKFNMEEEAIVQKVAEKIRSLVTSLNDPILENNQLKQSALQYQLNYALDLDAEHVLIVWKNSTVDEAKYNVLKQQIQFKGIPSENFINYWHLDDHLAYCLYFQEDVLSRLQQLIDYSIEHKPEINARNKVIQEVFKECIMHLDTCQKLTETFEAAGVNHDEVLSTIKKRIECNANESHPPIIICGEVGCGRTSLLTAVYDRCLQWLGEDTFRLIRFCGLTARSSSNLELLRIICEQITLLSQPEGPCVPRNASFDPLYVYDWFQTLMKTGVKDSPRNLVLIIDDLHRLNPADADIMAALSWLPTQLPRNVHIICTSLNAPNQLKMTPLQKERFSSTCIKMDTKVTPEGIEEMTSTKIDKLEEQFEEEAVGRFSAFITVSEFGLSETELISLLMPSRSSTFTFHSFLQIKNSLLADGLLMEKFMSGRLVMCWKHSSTYNWCRQRFLSSLHSARTLHQQIVNLFFSDINNSTHSDNKAIDAIEKDTPFHSESRWTDVCYSVRHVEESWIHLLKSGDEERLKALTLCNFDFFFACVRTISVSYLRCVLEHARYFVLDRDVELVYYTVRKASAVLTRDTLQLAAQIIAWLRRHSSSGNSALVNSLLVSAMAFCDGFSDPLLVPLTSWLQAPLPLFIKNVQCGSTITAMHPTPNSQHVVVLEGSLATLWHAMSNKLVNTFKGHTGAVTCLDITSDALKLVTGGEDCTVIVWDLKNFTIRLRIKEHIAPILSIAVARDDRMVVSGGEDSSIIMVDIRTGRLVRKIDHHRGPITSLLYNPIGIIVSGSMDGQVCVWDDESANVLKTVYPATTRVVIAVDVSSMFLLIATLTDELPCLVLHSVVTGTLVQKLQGYKGDLLSVRLANDNIRAMAGCSDGKVYVFDIRCGSVLVAINAVPYHTRVTSIKVTTKDDFLITAGDGNVAFWNFRDVGLENKTFTNLAVTGMSERSANKPKAHTLPITCLASSPDQTVAITGSADGSVNMWHMNSHQLQFTMEGHSSAITCLDICTAFFCTGAEDGLICVWAVGAPNLLATFSEHDATVTALRIMADNRRVISSDRAGWIVVWDGLNATKLSKKRMAEVLNLCVMKITRDMKYVLASNLKDCCVQIWAVNSLKEDSILEEGAKRGSHSSVAAISHTEAVTCFALTSDSTHCITGSQDMSLKVWQINDGKLVQVLVGHTDVVSCVDVSGDCGGTNGAMGMKNGGGNQPGGGGGVGNKAPVVVSGSWDTSLIVWDINTGAELKVLSAHLGHVTCVKLTTDGKLAVSGSDDKRILCWDVAKGGVPLCGLELHIPVLGLTMNSDASRMGVHLADSAHLPIVCLHNTPSTFIKAPVYEDSRPKKMSNPRRRLLKKDMSLDSQTWQRKYAHLTAASLAVVMDERLGRRFSISASMEDISTIENDANNKVGAGLGPEQAALAQSQHFDQLEALWNKKTPSKSRPSIKSISSSKQGSGSSFEELDTAN